MKPRPRPLTHRQIGRYLAELSVERRLAFYLEEMAECVAIGDVPHWLMTRHLFALTVMDASRQRDPARAS